MPTYDADVALRAIERTQKLVAHDFIDEHSREAFLADALLAATQEIERLNVLARCDHELNECSQLTIKRLTGEVERLRKLVERCCAELHDTGGEFAQQVADELLGEAGIAAIRHAAGLEEP